MKTTKYVNVVAPAMLLAIAAIPTAALADTGPRYSYGQIGYLNTEIDGEGLFGGDDPDGDGIGIGASVAVADMVHLFAGYSMSELDILDVDVDYDTLNVGAGVNYAIADNIDLVGRLAYIDVEVEVDGFGSADEDGYGLSAGARAMVTDQIEVNGFVNYVDLGSDSDDTSVAVGALYNFTEMFAAGVAGDFGSDSRVLGVFARLYFGER